MTPDSTSALSIAQASRAAFASFYENLFTDSGLSPSERRRALHLVADPLWRPLCELQANGTTSFEGAMILLGAKMLHISDFRVRSGPGAGIFVESVDLTEQGKQQFQEYAGRSSDTTFKGKLIDSLQAYVAIDMGAGIVASRSFIEGALENDDWEVLKRVRSIRDGYFMFRSVDTDYSMPGNERASYLQFTSDWGEERSGSEFIRLSPSS